MKRIILLALILIFGQQALPQAQRELTIDDLTKWNRITERVISDDGSLIAFKTEPWEGDPKVTLYDNAGSLKVSFNCATGVKITSDSRFLIFTIKPAEDTVRVLKLRKAKKDDMPLDMLGIYNVARGETDTVIRLKSFKVPEKWSGWIAYQAEPVKGKTSAKGQTAEKSGAENIKAGTEAEKEPGEKEVPEGKKENGSKPKSESADNGYALIIMNLNTGAADTVKFVTEYIFAEEAEILICATTGDDHGLEPGVILIDLKTGRRVAVYTGKAKFKQLTADKKGERVAFMATEDEKDKTGNKYSLYYWEGKGTAVNAAARGTAGIPEGWIINENGRLVFGEKSRRLFFGTSPAYMVKDTTVLDEDRPNVDVWHYNEGKLHTAQVISKARDARKNYTAVFHADLKKVVQLATPEMPDIQLIDNGDSPVALASSNLPYEVQSMWEGSQRYDLWLVDVLTGGVKQLKKDLNARMRVSPAGNYLYWYQNADSSWYDYDIAGGREYRLTDVAVLPCYDVLNDVPDAADSYPPAGWLKDDKAFLISDRYDIWSLDPKAGRAPVNVTVNGMRERITYRLIDFDPVNEYIDPSVKQYLHGISEVTRGSAYYSLDLKKKDVPLLLTGGSFSLGTPVKALKENTLIYTKENFEMFPDYLLSDLTFKSEKRLTDANPQQKDFLWGTAELVRWISLDGREVEGLLYKPAGFDPSGKYPMIVNFYEKSSTELYRHRIPEAGRSTIDYHYYTSNGYLVFNPDIYYTDGYPGQSAFNCVMPGIMSLVDKGFVDVKRIGAQGHSWGGYQVAYLATRTGLFAAIESGAPVVNMFSAYGGIRWESGANRSMQYEHQQSRIGATIWEAPQRFWENSPLFSMDKVTTPILIMANDNDGAVPWYQGIEYFIALRRLRKPAWLLNYNGEPHWPVKEPNKKDFQIRMSQFFNHYLKGEPMPGWMKDGIPATEKEFTLGY
jgi:dipeptidyl aminopeptidase/acylaminoacyl peptidase